MTEPGRSHHDMGGLAAGAIEQEPHERDMWEKRIDAMMVLLSDDKRRLLRVDELRHGIEQLGPGAYDEMTYYERWVASIANVMQIKGIVSTDELGRKMADVAARLATEDDG